jgi:inorganic triphosphatase YgiF
VSASEPPDPTDADELERARVAEEELAFLALLRKMLSHLMDAHKVESVADLPHAPHLVRRAVEECAVAKGIPPDVAAEIARRDLGFP